MLRSRDLSYFPRLQSASNNAPPMRLMEQGEPVQALQRALTDLGFTLPRSFARGAADGIYGQETIRAIREFQTKEALMCDGIAGSTTLHRMDYYLCTQYFGQSSMNTLLTPTSVVVCPHGGKVIMPLPRYAPVLTPEDMYPIMGCPFPSACVKVKWTVSNSRIRVNHHDTLDRSSVGLCLSALGQANGTASIIVV